MEVLIDGVSYKPVAIKEINDKKTSLGDALKAYRMFIKNETLDVACKGIGISKSHLWDIEADKTIPSLKIAVELSEYYGFPMSDYTLVTLGSQRQDRITNEQKETP